MRKREGGTGAGFAVVEEEMAEGALVLLRFFTEQTVIFLELRTDYCSYRWRDAGPRRRREHTGRNTRSAEPLSLYWPEIKSTATRY